MGKLTKKTIRTSEHLQKINIRLLHSDMYPSLSTQTCRSIMLKPEISEIE